MWREGVLHIVSCDFRYRPLLVSSWFLLVWVWFQIIYCLLVLNVERVPITSPFILRLMHKTTQRCKQFTVKLLRSKEVSSFLSASLRLIDCSPETDAFNVSQAFVSRAEVLALADDAQSDAEDHPTPSVPLPPLTFKKDSKVGPDLSRKMTKWVKQALGKYPASCTMQCLFVVRNHTWTQVSCNRRLQLQDVLS